MAQLSGLYGPSAALAGVGESISDIMKTWAGVKIQEAKLDLEGKQQDVNLARVMGEMEINRSKAGLETAKLGAEERWKEKEQGYKMATLAETQRHGMELESQGREQVQIAKEQKGINQQMLKIAQDNHKYAMLEKERGEEKISYQQYVTESPAIPPMWKKALLTAEPEILSQMNRRVDFNQMHKWMLTEKPGVAAMMIKQQLMDRYNKLSTAVKGIPKGNTPEEIAQNEAQAEAIMMGGGGLFDTHTMIVNMHMLGTQDEDDVIKAANAMVLKAESMGKDLTFGQAYSMIKKAQTDYQTEVGGPDKVFKNPQEMLQYVRLATHANQQGVDPDAYMATLAKGITETFQGLDEAQFATAVKERVKEFQKNYGEVKALELNKMISEKRKARTSPKAGVSLTPEERSVMGMQPGEALVKGAKSLGSLFKDAGPVPLM